MFSFSCYHMKSSFIVLSLVFSFLVKNSQAQSVIGVDVDTSIVAVSTVEDDSVSVSNSVIPVVETINDKETTVYYTIVDETTIVEDTASTGKFICI